MDINQVNSGLAAQQLQSQQPQLQPAIVSVLPADDKVIASQAVSAYSAVKDQVQIKYSTTSKNLDTVRAIEQMHAHINQLVKGVRETNEGLNQVSDKMDRMQSQLQMIIKNYPPYSADSSDRQKILMSYASIRKEIQQLMVPKPPTPVYDVVKKMWDGLYDEKGQISSAAVPLLDTASSDKHVKDAAAIISNSGDQLATLSNSITSALIKS